MKLFDALNQATNALYLSLSGDPVTITQTDVAALEDRVRAAFEATGYKKPFQIRITLDDEGELIDVKVKSGLDVAAIGLKFETPDGRLMVRVDTDGDGR